MANTMQVLEDCYMEMLAFEIQTKIKEIDPLAIDIKSEVKRHAREWQKFALVMLESRMLDPNGNPLIIELFGQRYENYSVNDIRQLEGNLLEAIPLPKEVEKLLDLSFDYEKLSKWDVVHIRCQAAAQTLWYENPNLKKEEIKRKLLDDHRLFNLLEIDNLSSLDNPNSDFRHFGKWIGRVSPRQGKRGRTPKNQNLTHFFTPIPLVFNKRSCKVNTQGLYHGLTTLGKVFAVQGISPNDIPNHPLIQEYKNLLPSLEFFIEKWITQAKEDL